MKTRRAALVVPFLSLVCVGYLNAQSIVYVDADAVGNNGGTSWDNAYTDLQSALSKAFFFDVDEIWVAEGTYYPDIGSNQTTGDRNSTFRSVEGVSMYGGFAGYETSREERDWSAHPTILSGDLARNDNDNIDADEPTRADNSYHVVTLDANIVFDGFVVTGGNANGMTMALRVSAGIYDLNAPTIRNTELQNNSSVSSGAGIRLQISGVLANLRFENNHSQDSGGGLYCWLCSHVVLDQLSFVGNSAAVGGGLYLQGGRTTLVQVTFAGNRATANGGAIWINGGEHRLTNVAFYGNVAHFDGGAIYGDAPDLSLANILFSGNWAGNSGGAVWTFGGSIEATNVTAAGNLADVDGGALYVWSGIQEWTNSILWGNEAGGNDNDVHSRESSTILSYSLIEGSSLPPGVADGGANILGADPLFVDPLGADGTVGTVDDSLRLRSGSPAIDSGDNAALPSDSLDLDNDGIFSEPLSADLDLKHRIYDAGVGLIVDMGAYEFGAMAVNVEERLFDSSSPFSAFVYPNPTDGLATVFLPTMETQEILTLTFYDALGRQVSKPRNLVVRAERHIPIDVSDNPQGVYFLQISDGAGKSAVLVIFLRK